MKKLAVFLFGFLMIWGCTDIGPSGSSADDFDREAILTNWADNIIIPSFTAFSEATTQLHAEASAFSENPNSENLTSLRSSWESAYLSFQNISMFEMGKPMELRYRDNMNIYPTDTQEIEENIQSGNYNLSLPSLNNSQGFPAIGYLLYGLGENDAEIIAQFATSENSDSYKTYLTDLTSRINSLTQEILDDWNGGYRDEFVSNSGNGSNSSLDMMVNDYIYYYEKHLRAGKIGIPAGVFSGSSLSTHVEAYYSEDFSKALFMASLDATQNFFNGVHFNQPTESGESLSSYLNYLNTMKGGSDLSALINEQFDAAREQAKTLDDNFAAQIETDNTPVLATYDQLQMNVVYMKVDMLQALNINVDYVDADGD